MNQTSKIILTVIITVILLGIGFYYLQSQKIGFYRQSDNSPTPSKRVVDRTKDKYSIITIIVPENYDMYIQNMTEYVQMGGENPLLTTKFVKKELTIPHTDDLINASAQAAAQEFTLSGGPDKASVSYLKTKGNTAYVLLNIDLEGWAGSSVSQAIIHPIVEKTLMQFPEISEVIFDYAPEDK